MRAPTKIPLGMSISTPLLESEVLVGPSVPVVSSESAVAVDSSSSSLVVGVAAEALVVDEADLEVRVTVEEGVFTVADIALHH